MIKSAGKSIVVVYFANDVNALVLSKLFSWKINPRKLILISFSCVNLPSSPQDHIPHVRHDDNHRTSHRTPNQNQWQTKIRRVTKEVRNFYNLLKCVHRLDTDFKSISPTCKVCSTSFFGEGVLNRGIGPNDYIIKWGTWPNSYNITYGEGGLSGPWKIIIKPARWER